MSYSILNLLNDGSSNGSVFDLCDYIKVVLLGSSRLLIKKGLTESLAGRFELIRITHWSYAEMRDAFGYTLDQFIYFGGYPGPAAMIDNERRWKKYIKDSLVAPAIEKDIIMTSNIYKPALMKRAFELGCGYSGELLGDLLDAVDPFYFVFLQLLPGGTDIQH